MKDFLVAIVGSQGAGTQQLKKQRGKQQKEEQERQRREREEQQTQQREQRRMQRSLALGREVDEEADGALEGAAAAAAAAVGGPAIAAAVGSRKRKQRSPVWVVQPQAAVGAGAATEEQQEQVRQEAEQHACSLPLRRPASAAGAAAMPPPALPTYRITPSIVSALGAGLPGQLHGVYKQKTTSAKQTETFQVTIGAQRQSTSITVRARQQAAVAHDLVVTWRVHAHDWQNPSQHNELNFPGAGYSQDAALIGQLRNVHDVGEIKRFLGEVLRQGPPAAGAAGPMAGRRKSEQQTLASALPPAGAAAAAAAATAGGVEQQQEQQQQQQQQLFAPAAAAAAAPAALPTPAHNHRSQAAVPLPQPSPSGAALLAARAAKEAQRKVEQVVQAFATADQDAPASMLRPLQHLLRALGKKGGAALQEVVAGWGSYSLERQQEVFGAALAVASEGDWEQLEGQLLLALDLTAEG